MYVYLTIAVTLYDCSQLGTDCSNCMSTNLGTGFECIWCDKQQTEDECTILDYCRIESTVTNHITRCPLPTITYVYISYLFHPAGTISILNSIFSLSSTSMYDYMKLVVQGRLILSGGLEPYYILQE